MPLDVVADLEAESVDEESAGRHVVGGTEDRVSELVRPDRVVAHHAGCAAVPFDAARTVVRSRFDTLLVQSRQDSNDGAKIGDRLVGGHLVAVPLREKAFRDQFVVDAVDVVEIVSADREFEESTRRRGDDPQLFATLGGRQPAVRCRRQPEFRVVGESFVDVRYAHGDRRESVQCHRRSPRLCRCDEALLDLADACDS
ncbi:Uncharacterised protein [Mycobacteroides abscessus subsp. abscessus]|nr:Uncharacterised protein [Mycobacteroides abscessus subsp. abscessus]